MRGLSASMAFFLLTGCAHGFGPADGVFYAVGSTRDNDSCQLSVAPVGSSNAPREWTVAGKFRQSVMVAPSRKGHRVALICNGELTVERTFKNGRDVDAGGELAVTGSAP